MPQEKTYKVKDTQSGKTVTFKWSDPTPPTDTDFEEVFKSAGLRESQQPVSYANPAVDLGAKTVSSAQQQFPQFQQAADKMRKGSLVAGAAQAGNAALNTALSPLGAVDQTVREKVPMGNLLMSLLSLIPQAAGKVGETVAKSGLGYAGLLDHNLGTSPENAQQIRKEVPALAGTVASIGLPVMGAKSGRVKAAGEPPPMIAQRLYQKALRPSGNLDVQTQKVATGISERLTPGFKSAGRKLDNIVQDINSKIDATIKSTDYIQTQNTLNHVQPLLDKINSREMTPEATVRDVTKQVIDYQDQRGAQMPATLAQEIKKGIYEKRKSAYEQQEKTGKAPGWDIKTEQAIARGLKDELNTLYPELKGLNAREGHLLQIERDLQRSIRQELNHPILPHSLLVALSPKWWFVRLVSDNPALKAHIAYAISTAAKVRPPLTGVPTPQEQE